MKSLIFRLLCLALLLAAPSPLSAAAGPWAENDHARVRLISAGDALGDTGQLRLGLQFELAEGWKTYWRSPGDAGYPPSLDWSASANLADARMDWPVPHRFQLFGLQTFGYDKEVVFPITAEVKSTERSALFEATVSYLLCAEICIPYDQQVSLVLPAGPAGPSDEAFLIDLYESRVPGPGAAMEIEEARLLEGEDGPRLEVRASSALPFSTPDVLVEGAGSLSFLPPEVELGEGGTAVTLTSSIEGEGAGSLVGQSLRLTLVDGTRGAEGELTVLLGDARGADATGYGGNLFVILTLALLGGLILNLMPCVLPVLSLKLLALVGHGGRDPAQVRRSFLASSAGIVSSFLVLALAAIGLREAGLAVGWSIQFQQPVFLAFMALVISFFAYNLFGLFEITLPGWLSNTAAGGDEKSLTGSFVTGALATLLATPCSAPFVGTAISFALSREAGEILAVFLAMGLGLALPYLVFAALPRLAVRMPRPGRWMLLLRRILGLALAATALWLLSVIAAQAGLATALTIGALLVAMAGAFFARRRGLPKPAEGALLAVLSLGAIAVAALPGDPGSPRDGVLADSRWAPLSGEEIVRLVEAGQVVFVDVTADWCITCQVNKTLVVERDPVAGALDEPGVSLMRGDWTTPDPMISDYLAAFGRYGIPFNAVYGPGAPEGIALPELLTGDSVLEALEAARGG